jgi:DNA repair protein RadC
MRQYRTDAAGGSCIKEWPESERPREKLLQRGAGALSDAELLALLIGSGTGKRTALDLARRFLIEHDDLCTLSSISAIKLTRMKGIGSARCARLLAAFEIGRRIERREPLRRRQISGPEDVVRTCRPAYRGLKKEIFKVLLLDSGNRLINEVAVSQGILNASLVHPREVFKAAVDHLAAGIVLVHNHPSGNTAPSREDRKVTGQMVRAGEILDIPILDHIIITENAHFSFACEGLLK